MKLTSKFSAALASVGLLIAASAQDAVKFNVPGVTTPAAPATQPSAPATKPAAAPAATALAPKKFTEAQVAEAYGWFVGAQLGLRQLEFTKEQIDALARGLQGMAGGGNPPFDTKEIGPEVEAFLARKNQVFMGKLKAQQMAMNIEFFTKLKENKAVIETPSGLRYEVVKAGTGAVAKPGQVVTVNLTGALLTGQVFDSSAERGGAVDMLLVPASAQNPQGTISGMVEGLQKTGVGGKLKLYVPPQLAFGDEGAAGVIPPSATLVFEVEIVAIKDAPAAK